MLKSDFLNEINTRGFIYQSSEMEELDSIISKKNKFCDVSAIGK